MKPRHKWTEEEDKVLVQAIKANPQNRAQAFRETAKTLNVDPISCQNRWYNALSNPESKNYVGCCFTMLGVASTTCNRTFLRENARTTTTKIKETLWFKIKELLKL